MLFNLQTTPPAPSAPIFIKIEPPPSDIEGLGDVLLGALGITGAIVMAALVCGLLFAGIIYGVRKFQDARDHSADARF